MASPGATLAFVLVLAFLAVRAAVGMPCRCGHCVLKVRVDLITKWWKRNFAQAYKELAYLRWCRQLTAGTGASGATSSS